MFIKVLDLFVKRGHIERHQAEDMKTWEFTLAETLEARLPTSILFLLDLDFLPETLLYNH